MKIISCNVNGIRSAYQKGLYDFFRKEKPDILCLQEIKAQEKDISHELLHIEGYYAFFQPAQKPGYSGVAVYSKEKPDSVDRLLGMDRFDKEGRMLALVYRQFILCNVYIPHGGRQKENLDYKLEVYRDILKKAKKMKNQPSVFIGDFNIAHKETDLANPIQNKNNIMFTPEERKKLDALVELGYVDSFRMLYKDTRHYTWWPYAYDARKRNIGWRLDYAFVSEGLSKTVRSACIYPEADFSDHCPIGVDISFV